MVNSNSPKSAVDRRSALKTIGYTLSASVGFGLASGSAVAHEYCGNHWANGSELTCYFRDHWKFNGIYNSFKDWENSLVSLSHNDWDGNIKLRVGTVLQTDNNLVQDVWENYYEEGNGSDDLGDDRQIMLAGTWGSSDQNRWSWTNHIGRINTWRCADSDAAQKYWYHEIGHAHTLGHRDDSSALMNPNSWFGFSFSTDETEQWRECYNYSSCSSSIPSYPDETADKGVTEAEVSEEDRQEIDIPTVVEKQPLPE